MLIGLWLSRPRVHDKVAVVSVISSTITTPGGPGGPGEEKGALKRSNEKGLKEGRSVSLFASIMFSTSDAHPSLLLSDTLMSTPGTTCYYLHKVKTPVLFNSLHKQGNKQTQKGKNAVN